MWTRRRAAGGPRRGARRRARPGRPGRGRGVPRRRTARAPTGSPSRGRASAGSAVRDPATGRSSRSGAASRARRGTPTLAGIAVARPTGGGRAGARRSPPTSPGWRCGRSGACALGMFADNDVARRRLPPARVHDRDGVDEPLVRPGGERRDPLAPCEPSVPRAKGQRCPRSATAPVSLHVEDTRRRRPARRPHPRLAAQRRVVVGAGARRSPRPATGSSPTTAAASARPTSPATPAPTTTTR